MRRPLNASRKTLSFLLAGLHSQKLEGQILQGKAPGLLFKASNEDSAKPI